MIEKQRILRGVLEPSCEKVHVFRRKINPRKQKEGKTEGFLTPGFRKRSARAPVKLHFEE